MQGGFHIPFLCYSTNQIFAKHLLTGNYYVVWTISGDRGWRLLTLMQNTFCLAENINTDSHVSNEQRAHAKVLGEKTQRNNAGKTHNKKAACKQLLFLWELNLCKCFELILMLTSRLRRGKSRKEETTKPLFSFLNLNLMQLSYISTCLVNTLQHEICSDTDRGIFLARSLHLNYQ